MKANTAPLVPEKFFHIYNRGINGETIFKKAGHYEVFMKKYFHHVSPFVYTLAYCMLGNHFHLLVRLKSEAEIQQAAEVRYGNKIIDNKSLFVARQFGHLFNGYSQVINKDCDRTGGLFETPFRRILVESDSYLSNLIGYIHQNPEKHGFVNDFKHYKHSSYWSHLEKSRPELASDEVLDWFGGVEQYKKFHEVDRYSWDLKKELIEFDE